MEGIPVALMEAMAMGVLVITTSHSGIPELVSDGRSGWLVPERDPDAIARALSACGAQSSATVRMRRAAREAVEARFDNRMIDAQLVSVCLRISHRGR